MKTRHWVYSQPKSFCSSNVFAHVGAYMFTLDLSTTFQYFKQYEHTSRSKLNIDVKINFGLAVVKNFYTLLSKNVSCTTLFIFLSICYFRLYRYFPTWSLNKVYTQHNKNKRSSKVVLLYSAIPLPSIKIAVYKNNSKLLPQRMLLAQVGRCSRNRECELPEELLLFCNPLNPLKAITALQC